MTTPDAVRDRVAPLVADEEGLPEGWATMLSRFLGLLLDRNRAVNLVSRRTAAEVVDRHLVPSLAGLRILPPGRSLRLLDVGAGGGFPGIPLRILRPRVRLDLVEATAKKCRFLEECVRELDLAGAHVHWCRIEEPPEAVRARAPFDRILSRAMGRQDLLVRGGAGLLAPDGEIWVFGSPGQGDLDWSDREGRPVTSLERLVPAPAPRRGETRGGSASSS